MINTPEKFNTLIGHDSYMALINGGSFHVWNRSSPANKWVEDKDGNPLWHSGDDLCLIEYQKRLNMHQKYLSDLITP